VNLDTDRIAELADRPVTALTRRDVALALLAVPAADALASLPGIRRGMLAAGNPLSAAFWESADRVLTLIDDGEATVGDVRTWLEATGTEPAGMIGIHVWDEASERSQLAEEMHVRLVSYLEEQLGAGQIDPDLLVSGEPGARRTYIEIQERWMTSPLADGRVPMDVLLDEKDEELFAEWDAADAEALEALENLIAAAPERPEPEEELHAACARLREILTDGQWPAELLIECGGLDVKQLPADDAELWLTLAAGIASPVGTEATWSAEPLDDDEELSEQDSVVAALCAIDHYDWLAVTSALITGGPGTPASAADLAGYVRDFEPDDDLEEEEEEDDEDGDEDEEDDDLEEEEEEGGEYVFLMDDDEEFDELGMESLFVSVTTLWQQIGLVDEDEQLTALGWWGLPEAMRRVWSPAED
jgi:hypothetical protein